MPLAQDLEGLVDRVVWHSVIVYLVLCSTNGRVNNNDIPLCGQHTSTPRSIKKHNKYSINSLRDLRQGILSPPVEMVVNLIQICTKKFETVGLSNLSIFAAQMKVDP